MTLREKSVDNEMFDSAIRWVQQIQDQLPPTLKGEAALIAGKLDQLREKVLRVPVQEDAA